MAKVIASPIIEMLLGATNADGTLVDPTRLYKLFYILAVVYFIMMFTGHLLLKKPSDWVEVTVQRRKANHPRYLQEQDIHRHLVDVLHQHHLRIGAHLAGEGFAAFHRLRRSRSDQLIDGALQRKRTAWLCIVRRQVEGQEYHLYLDFRSVDCSYGDYAFGERINNAIAPLVILLLCVINAGYGGGFSSLPPLLGRPLRNEQHQHHPWTDFIGLGFCRFSGNQLSAFIIAKTGSYQQCSCMSSWHCMRSRSSSALSC